MELVLKLNLKNAVNYIITNGLFKAWQKANQKTYALMEESNAEKLIRATENLMPLYNGEIDEDYWNIYIKQINRLLGSLEYLTSYIETILEFVPQTPDFLTISKVNPVTDNPVVRRPFTIQASDNSTISNVQQTYISSSSQRQNYDGNRCPETGEKIGVCRCNRYCDSK